MEQRKRPARWPARVGTVSAAGADRGLLGINVRYFAIRAALFGAVLAVVLLLGVDGFLAFVLALGLSGLLSYPLALRQRRAVLDVMENRHGGSC